MTVIGATMVNWNTIHTVSQAIVTQHVLTALQVVIVRHTMATGVTTAITSTAHLALLAAAAIVLTALQTDTAHIPMLAMLAITANFIIMQDAEQIYYYAGFYCKEDNQNSINLHCALYCCPC
jgi:hypothetical protein